MEEPSVLDYLLEKLAFWKEPQLTIPPSEEPKPEKPRIPSTELEHKFWRGFLVLIPILLAIIAQIFSEPTNRSSELVIGFYVAAVLSLILLIVFRGWEFEPPDVDEEQTEKITLRWIQFSGGIVLSILAFLFFQGNIFNGVNLTLWLAGFLLTWFSIWVPVNGITKLRSLWDDFWKKGIQITPEKIWIGLAFLLAAFYRLYLIDQVPPEMFSDHAEKLLDITNVLNGQTSIFFIRNTGREALQMYLTAAIIKYFGTGISFLSLKLGTCLMGLFSLPFIYLLGVEIKNEKVGLFAMFFAGIAYWPNVIARVALRFALYPALLAPTLYFLIRGLKRKKWNDFLLAGLFLGIGLHGYSPFRIVPIVVIIISVIFFLHSKTPNNRRLAIISLVLVGLISLIVFLPLGRFAVDNYDLFSYRMQTRMTGVENPLPDTPLNIFFSNLWKSLIMFQWDNGQIWVHSISDRPALGVITAALFSIGVVLVIARYIKYRNWMDLVLVLSIPLLMLPSVLSLAFPDENPSLNRSGGALVPVFLIVALAIENIILNFRSYFPRRLGKWIANGLIVVVVVISMSINYRLVFEDYYFHFKVRAWNTSEIGGVIRQFSETIGDEYKAWVVPYPHWIDTRLVGIHAVGQVRDLALWPSELYLTENEPPPKLFIYKPEDVEAIGVLRDLYPLGIIRRYQSEVEGRDFMLYYVLE